MVKSISALKNEISTCEKNMQQTLSQCASLVGGETNFVFCFFCNNSSTVSRCVLKRWVMLQIVIVCRFFGYFTNLLHNNMAVIASQIVQDNWFLDFINLSSEVTDITMLMRWPPVLSCDVAAVLTLFYNFFCMIYRHSLACLNLCLSSSDIFNGLFKCPLAVFFAAINFFSCHEFIDSIFSSVYLNWLPVLVITTTDYFVTISTVCMFLICFSVWFIIVCCLVQMCESFLLLFQNLHRWWNVLVIVCENDWISVHYCLYQVVIT